MSEVLFLSPFFFPEPISTGKYNTIITKALSDTQVSVDVMCAHPIYPSWTVEPSHAELPGITIFRGGRYLRFPANPLLRRAILEIWYCLFVATKLTFSKKKYTHIISVFPPSLFMLLVPLFQSKSKSIGIVHDLQGVYAALDGSTFKKLIYKAIKWVERRAFTSCDRLIFLSDEMARVATSHYGLDADSQEIHYPFVTIEDFRDRGHLRNLLPNDQQSLVYSGALGEKQAPWELARFMSEFVKQNRQFTAYIFSQGPIFEELKREFSNIKFNKLVEEEDLPELLLRSTIQILPQAKGTSSGSLPSKLPNILASGVKLVAVTDENSEVAEILSKIPNACVMYDWEPLQLVSAVQELASSDSGDDNCANLQKFRVENLVANLLRS